MIERIQSIIDLTGDTRKIFVKTVDESHSARVLIGCKPINIDDIIIFIDLGTRIYFPLIT